MFQDEARFGRINDVRRCWAPKPVRPLCQTMLMHEYTYAAVDPLSGELDSLILPHVYAHSRQCSSMRLGSGTPSTSSCWCSTARVGKPAGTLRHRPKCGL